MNSKTYGLKTPCLLKPKCKSPDKIILQITCTSQVVAKTVSSKVP